MKPMHAFLVLLLCAGTYSLAPRSSPASVASPEPGSVRIFPVSPCPDDTVLFYAFAFPDWQCETLLSVERLSPDRVRVRRLRAIGRCAPPTSYVAVPVTMGLYPVGSHSIVVEDEVIEILPGVTDTVRSESTIGFQVSEACPARPPVTEVPRINGFSVVRSPASADQPCAEQPATLTLWGHYHVYSRITEAVVLDRGRVSMTIEDGLPGSALESPTLWNQRFDLGRLPAGPGQVTVEFIVLEPDTIGTVVRNVNYGVAEFRIPECPPGDSLPPFVSHIEVRGPAPDGTICPADSIEVLVEGAFPSDCYQLKGIRLLPSPIASPLPQPPIVQIVVDDMGCTEVVCREVLVPWHARAVLPPLPSAVYGLITRMGITTCSDSIRPDRNFTTVVPFRVASGDSCGHGLSCFLPRWVHPPGFPDCDTTIAAGRDAHLTFALRSSVALAGLQGAFAFAPAGLVITSIEPVGPAAGMKITSSTTANGARFVMFATNGAPIPASQEPVPILRLTLRAATVETAIPAVTVVSAYDLLGSDADGHAVGHCPVREPARSLVDVARICREDACDFNADVHTDIRDLVLMARCLQIGPACTDSVGTKFDCDQDGAFGLDDVFCCARRVLGLPHCPDCPPDTTRPVDGIALRFGAPRRAGDGIDVPLFLSRAEALGGVRLEITFPAGVFTSSTLVVNGHPAEWLEVNESGRGVQKLGMIRLESVLDIRVPDPLPLTLHLTLAPGREPEGELGVDAEFSDLDGALLAIPFDPALPLGGRLAISRPRPNPFGAETRFTVALPREGPVTITVHDIVGRRVATLFDGVRPAGVLALSWNGRADRGGVAGNGIYFLRVRGGGRTVATKLIRMGAR